MKDAEILVIGAGLAGLAAARAVQAAGRRAIVLEASDRVGGRAHNGRLEGAIVELGAAFVGPTHTAVRALASELGVELFPTFDAGAHLLEIRGRTTRWRGLPRVGAHRLLDFQQARSRLDRLAASVDPAAPWAHPRADALDAVSAEAWLGRVPRSRVVREALRAALHTVLTTDPGDVSLLHLAHYVGAAGGFDALTLTTGGAQQDRVRGGSQALADGLAARVRVERGEPVRAVAQDAGGVTVTARRTWRADRVICTVPPPLEARIDWDPALPLARRQLVARLPMSAGTKWFAVYDEPFWRADGLSGQVLTDRGPLRATFDASPPEGRPGVLMAFVEGSDALGYWSRPDRERDRVALDAVGRWFGPRALRPVALLAHEWSDAPWARGCLAHLAPGVWTRLGPALREPVGRIHWATAESSEVWPGYMEGALRAGARAAVRALAG